MRRRTVIAAGVSAVVLPAGAQQITSTTASSSTRNIVPALPRTVEVSYFGMHFHRLVRRPGERHPGTAWPALAIGTLRLWDSDTRWGDVAPRAGEWNFDRMDAYVDAAALHSASVLYTLGSPPRWASARPDEPGPYGPGSAAEPRNLAHWGEYVRRVVERYRGRIAAYELWNEPSFSDIERDRGAPGFYTGDVATMVRMGQIARATIDTFDPAARLLTPGFVNGSDRLGLFLSRGGAALVDAVAYHFYARTCARLRSEVAEVRALMKQYGVANLPLWNTECGIETNPPEAPIPAGMAERVTEETAAETLAQLLLLGAALGLERFYYYAWDNGHSGMIDTTGAERPRQVAMRRVQAWLLGARIVAVEPFGGDGWLIRAQSGSLQQWMVWHRAGAAQAMSLPVGWHLVELDAINASPPPIRWIKAGAILALPPSAAPIRLTLERA